MAPRPASGIRRVTLSVGRHVYTSEIWRETEISWVLLKVQVRRVGVVGGIEFHRTSCLEVLRRAEAVAMEIISFEVKGLNDETRLSHLGRLTGG